MAPDPYIRLTDPDDIGTRPIPAGVNFYATPAIRIVKPAGMGLDPDPAIVYADVDDQFVHVDVGNRGTTDAEATVTVWAVGFGTSPTGYSPTLGDVTGRSQAVTIPAGSSGSTTFVNIPWKPQGGELGGGTELHCCVQANVFVDPNDQEPDPPGTAPHIDVPNIIRHAQRNMTLKASPTPSKAMKFDILTGNPDEEAGEFEFEFREVRGKFGAVEIAHLRRTQWVDRATKDRLTLRGSRGKILVGPAKRPSPGFAMTLGRERGERLVAKFKPGQQRKMSLNMEFAPGADGAVYRFDVIQRQGKRVIGAARVMTMAVPEELIARVREEF